MQGTIAQGLLEAQGAASEAPVVIASSQHAAHEATMLLLHPRLLL